MQEGAQITRRTVLALPTVLLLPAETLAMPVLVVVALKALVAKAVEYLAGKVLDSLFSQSDTSTATIIEFVRTSIETLERELKADFRRAITEDRIRELIAHAESVQNNLILYSKLKPRDRANYRSLLNEATTQTADGAAAALRFGIPTLPTYAVFITQRIFVMQSYYLLDHGSSILSAYSSELNESADNVRTALAEYEKALNPDVRIGAMECYVRENDGGFAVRYIGCKFKVDGADDQSYAYEDIDPNHDREAAVRSKAEQIRQAKTAELQAFKVDQIANFINPMRDVADKWTSMASVFAGRRHHHRVTSR